MFRLQGQHLAAVLQDASKSMLRFCYYALWAKRHQTSAHLCLTVVTLTLTIPLQRGKLNTQKMNLEQLDRHFLILSVSWISFCQQIILLFRRWLWKLYSNGLCRYQRLSRSYRGHVPPIFLTSGQGHATQIYRVVSKNSGGLKGYIAATSMPASNNNVNYTI